MASRSVEPLTAIAVLLAVQVMGGACFAQGQERADAVADFADAALWNFKVLYVLPTNIEEFKKSFEAEQEKLKPGESKEFQEPVAKPLNH